MRLTRNSKAISKLTLILILLIFFLLGGLLSYVWTMGFYAPNEYNLPAEANLTVEKLVFYPSNATFFNITVLNPSYSPTRASILRLRAATGDGKVHSISTTAPNLPVTLEPGTSNTIKSFWDWRNYTGQPVDFYVLIGEGSGAAVQARTPFMNFTIMSVALNSSISVNHLNVTASNVGSSTSVNITKILVNGVSVPTIPDLTSTYELTNASGTEPTTFMLMRNWTDLQGKNIGIEIQTAQGHSAYKTVFAPSPIALRITDVRFDINYLDRFNITVQNPQNSSKNFVDINEVKLLVESRTIIPNITQAFPQRLQWNSSITLTPLWNWTADEGKNLTIIVSTAQGFTVSQVVSIIPEPRVAFIRWADGVRVTAFDYSINVSPSVKIPNENITHGIWNWDKTNHTVYVRISNIINITYIQNVTMYVRLGNETTATILWNSSNPLPAFWVSFNVTASTKYTIRLEVFTTSAAVEGQTSIISVETKTQIP